MFVYLIIMVPATPYDFANRVANIFGLFLGIFALAEILIYRGAKTSDGNPVVVLPFIPLVIFILLHWFHALFVSGYTTFGFIFALSQQIALFVLIFWIVYDTKKTELFLVFFSISVLVIFAMSASMLVDIREQGARGRLWVGREEGSTEGGLNPNSIGVILNFMILLAIKHIMLESFFMRKKMLSIFLVIPAVVVAAYLILFVLGSRQHHIWFLFTISASPILWMLGRQPLKRCIIALCFIPLIMIGGWTVLKQSQHFERLEKAILSFEDNTVSEGSFEARKLFFYTGFGMWLQKPVTGHGLEGFTRFSGFNTYSHNQVIELLVNFGLIGLILFYSIHARVIYKIASCWRNSPLQVRRGMVWVLIALSGVMFQNMAKPTIYEKQMWVCLGVLFGFSEMLTRKYALVIFRKKVPFNNLNKTNE